MSKATRAAHDVQDARRQLQDNVALLRSPGEVRSPAHAQQLAQIAELLDQAERGMSWTAALHGPMPQRYDLELADAFRELSERSDRPVLAFHMTVVSGALQRRITQEQPMSASELRVMLTLFGL